MKINHAQIDKLYGAMVSQNLSQLPKGDRKRVDAGKDSLVLSSAAKGYSELDEAVSMAVDESSKATTPERLLSLKNQIALGTYYVSAQNIAEAILFGTEAAQ